MKHSAILVSVLAVIMGCDSTGSGPVGATSPSLRVERGELPVPLLLTGELEAESSLELSAPRTETFELSIRWIAKDGEVVKEGERLVEFDDTALLNSIGDLEIELLQSGNELVNLRSTQAVEIAEKGFAERQAEVEAAKAQIDADTPPDILSRVEFNQYQLAYGRARLAHDAAQIDQSVAARGSKLEEQVQGLKYDKAKRKYSAARDEIDSLTLRAPQEGVMIVPENPFEGRKLQVGDKVFPGFPVAKLPDLSKMIVRAVLSDVDDGRVHPGMKVDCILDAHPERVFAGLVRSVNPVAREPDRDSTRRFFSVVIELDETDEAIMRPGLSVQARVLSEHRPEVLLVPRAAIESRADGDFAYDAKGEAHPVELGACNAQACEVIRGLEDGDRLGAAPVSSSKAQRGPGEAKG